MKKTKSLSYTTRINSVYPSLNDTEKRIADYISNNIKVVSHSTISQISSAIGVADSTFFKFTKMLGYDGFTDFKIALLTEDFDPEISLKKELNTKDDDSTIAKKICESSKRSINNTIELIDSKTFKKAVDYITTARQVAFFGLGGSNVMAFDAYHLFMRSPFKCIYNCDYDMQTMAASLLSKEDVAIIISHSGKTSGAIEIENICLENKVPVIAISSNPISPIAKSANILLQSATDELTYRSESMPSRVSQYCIINALFVTSMLRDQDNSTKTIDTIHKTLSKIEKNK